MARKRGGIFIIAGEPMNRVHACRHTSARSGASRTRQRHTQQIVCSRSRSIPFLLSPSDPNEPQPQVNYPSPSHSLGRRRRRRPFAGLTCVHFIISTNGHRKRTDGRVAVSPFRLEEGESHSAAEGRCALCFE